MQVAEVGTISLFAGEVMVLAVLLPVAAVKVAIIMNTSPASQLRRILHNGKLVTLAVLLSVPLIYGEPASASSAITIVDTLGVATPSTTFSYFGSGAQVISRDSEEGPEFVLSQATEITEIGAFILSCELNIYNVPECAQQPVLVKIRPALNGIPDASTVLASYPLPPDKNPLQYSYRSVTPNLLLGPGTYFATFATQGDDVSLLLGFASIPFEYRPELATIGFVPRTASPFVVRQEQAFRILGVPALQVPIDIKPGSPLNQINLKSNGRIRVAILSTASFDAPSQVDRQSLTFGETGSEKTLVGCERNTPDVNHDGRTDLVCSFEIRGAGFRPGDRVGTLMGRTLTGVPLFGSDSIHIVPGNS